MRGLIGHRLFHKWVFFAPFCLILLLLASQTNAAPAHYLKASVTNNLKDNANCPGWTDKLQWAIKSGECNSGGAFTPVACVNDQTKTINPGGTVHAECQLNELPAGNFETYCLRVIWCKKGPKVPGSYKLDNDVVTGGSASCTEGECDCSVSEDGGMKCCTGGKMVSADTWVFCGKCPENRLCPHNAPSCIDAGGSCDSCPEGWEIEKRITDVSGCTDSCWKCKPKVPIQKLCAQIPGATCACATDQECKPENKVYDTTDCKDTCCKCTQKAPLKVLHIVYVPLGYDMATQKADFENAVALSANYFLEQTPFKECKNKNDLVKFDYLTDECPLAEKYLKSCNVPLLLTELKNCVANSRLGGVVNNVQGLYNGVISSDIGCNFIGKGERGGVVAASVASTKSYGKQSDPTCPGGRIDITINNEQTSTHELAHNFGLCKGKSCSPPTFGHCSVTSCIMAEEDSISYKIDSQCQLLSATHERINFCPDCYNALKTALSLYLAGCQR
jgi:hypothetical protein